MSPAPILLAARRVLRGVALSAAALCCGCAAAPAASGSSSPPATTQPARGWESLGADPALDPIDVGAAADAWTQAGAGPAGALVGPRVEVAPDAIRLDGRPLVPLDFRTGAIGLLSTRGARPARGHDPLAELTGALAAAAAESRGQWSLALDRRASMAVVAAVGASAQRAGLSAPVFLARGPEGALWSLPVRPGRGCESPAPPALGPAPATEPLPHRYAFAPVSLWGPCASDSAQRALAPVLEGVAQCAAAAVASAPLLRDEADLLRVGVVVGANGRSDGYYLESRFAGIDRGLVPCIAGRIRQLAMPPLGERCLANATVRFQAGDSPDSRLAPPEGGPAQIASLPAPLTWGRVELRRRGLWVELGHASGDARCPQGGLLFARLEDVRASTLSAWLNDIVGAKVRTSRVDASGEGAMPVGSVLPLATTLWTGDRASDGVQVVLSVVAE